MIATKRSKPKHLDRPMLAVCLFKSAGFNLQQESLSAKRLDANITFDHVHLTVVSR